MNICSNDALLPYLNLENVSYTFEVEVKVLPATRCLHKVGHIKPRDLLVWSWPFGRRFTSGLQVTQNLHMFTVNGNILKKILIKYKMIFSIMLQDERTDKCFQCFPLINVENFTYKCTHFNASDNINLYSIPPHFMLLVYYLI